MRTQTTKPKSSRARIRAVRVVAVLIYVMSAFLGFTAQTVAESSAAVAIARTPSGDGHWLAHDDGRVDALGRAKFYGDMTSALCCIEEVRAIAATPSGRGYWLVGPDANNHGRVVAFGDAKFYGDGTTYGPISDMPDIVGIAATPSGRGYWLANAAGRVEEYGDAELYGDASSHPVPCCPWRAILATPSGRGYWLAANDGTITGFGDAMQVVRRGGPGCPPSDPKC